MMDEKDALSSDVAQDSPVTTTHDELLAKINEASPADKIDAGWQSALRAVVELHKPLKFSDEQTMCVGCSLKKFAHPYPCPTIQAIEKELK